MIDNAFHGFLDVPSRRTIQKCNPSWHSVWHRALMPRKLVAIWQDIDVAVRPILGHQGVVALYKRSIFLARRAHPWLTELHDRSAAAMNLDELREAVAHTDNADALEGSDAMLQTFHELLASLVGSSLTERLLRPVVQNTQSGPSAQEISV